MLWETRIERGIPYADLETLQEHLTDQVEKNPHQAFLLFSEPTATYTCGRSGTEEDLLWREAQLAQAGIRTFQVSRGGKWTYHGPGQMVIYPIVHLPTLGYSSKEVRLFLEDFRRSVVEYLLALSLPVETGENPFGIYSGERKLASFGFRFKRGIANHGLALYIAPQHSAFQGIHPCGVTHQPFSSLGELGLHLPWEDLALPLAQSIKKGFTLRKN